MYLVAQYQKVVKQFNHNQSPKVFVALQKLDVDAHDAKDWDEKCVNTAKSARKMLDWYYAELQKEVAKFPQGSKEKKDAFSLGLQIKKLDQEIVKMIAQAKGSTSGGDKPVAIASTFLQNYRSLVNRYEGSMDGDLSTLFSKLDDEKEPKKVADFCKKTLSAIDKECSQLKREAQKAKDSKERGEILKQESGLAKMKGDVRDYDGKVAKANKHLL